MKKKYTFINFHLFEIDTIQEYLHDMAKQGWMLKKLRFGFTVFERCEPQDIYFVIEIYEKGSILNPYFVNEEQVQYSDFIESYGYELINSYSNYQVYKTNKKIELPIHSYVDETMRKRRNRAILKQEIYMYLFILILPILNFRPSRTFNSLHTYQNTSLLLLSLLVIPLYILIILRAIPVFRWILIKERYHISVKHMLVRDRFYAVCLSVILLLGAFTLCFANNTSFTYIFLFLGWITFICFPVFLGLDYILSRWIKKHHAVPALLISLYLGCIFPIHMMTSNMLKQPEETIKVSDALFHGSDFQDDLPPMTSNEQEKKDSIFLTTQSYYERFQCRENYKGYTSFCDNLYYTIYTIKNTPLKEHITSLILNPEYRAPAFKGKILDWDWYQNDSDDVYLTKDNHIIELSMTMYEPTQKQLEFVAEKLNQLE